MIAIECRFGTKLKETRLSDIERQCKSAQVISNGDETLIKSILIPRVPGNYPETVLKINFHREFTLFSSTVNQKVRPSFLICAHHSFSSWTLQILNATGAFDYDYKTRWLVNHAHRIRPKLKCALACATIKQTRHPKRENEMFLVKIEKWSLTCNLGETFHLSPYIRRPFIFSLLLPLFVHWIVYLPWFDFSSFHHLSLDVVQMILILMKCFDGTINIDIDRWIICNFN